MFHKKKVAELEMFKMADFPASAIIAPSSIQTSMDYEDKIGEGDFTTVYKREYQGMIVAVKEIPNANVNESPWLQSYINVIKESLCRLQVNKNVVKILGVILDSRSWNSSIITFKVVFEYAPYGTLYDYLRQMSAKKKVGGAVATRPDPRFQPETETDHPAMYTLINWCAQISSGMEYMSDYGFVHGDLAAFKILRFGDDVLKINLSGYSAFTGAGKCYRMDKEITVPYRWAAPETLEHLEFSSKADVWSYGVTVWEIFSLCRTPYGTREWGRSFISELKNGKLRLEKPFTATSIIYDMMNTCWNVEPGARPSFTDISKFWRFRYGILT